MFNVSDEIADQSDQRSSGIGEKINADILLFDQHHTYFEDEPGRRIGGQIAGAR